MTTNQAWCPSLLMYANHLTTNGGTQEDLNKLFNPEPQEESE